MLFRLEVRLKMKKFSYALTGLALACLLSCKEEEIEKPKPDPDPEPPVENVSVTLSSDALSVVVGETVALEALVQPAEKAATLEWTAGDPEIVTWSRTKSAAPAEEGVSSIVITGESIGRTTVVAAVDNCFATCTVEVLPKMATAVLLNKNELSLHPGESETLTASVEPEDVSYPGVSWSSDREEVAIVEAGKVTALSPGTAVITAASGELSARCTVTVTEVVVESLTLDVTSRELVVQEILMLTATLAPANATDKNVEWTTSDAAVASVEKIDASTEDDYVNGKVTALSEGTAEITATCGALTARCTVTVVAPEEPVAEPKIGDYFYSDGSWSDGGLLRIDPDGRNPEWASPKPAPKADKTVIGIVFQTRPERISDTDKENGFTHGYVVCSWSAHAPGRTTTFYSYDWNIGFMKAIKSGKSYYENLNGYLETRAALAAYEGRVDQIPAFDWTTTDFHVGAPTSTSGWYLPSTGQMWDMLANLCGHEVAEGLLPYRDYGYDITYVNHPFTASYDLISAFNDTLALVPDDQKEELPGTETYNGETICEIWTSSLYHANEDACGALFEIGAKGYFWIGTEWVDYPAVARPILSF